MWPQWSARIYSPERLFFSRLWKISNPLETSETMFWLISFPVAMQMPQLFTFLVVLLQVPRRVQLSFQLFNLSTFSNTYRVGTVCRFRTFCFFFLLLSFVVQAFGLGVYFLRFAFGHLKNKWELHLSKGSTCKHTLFNFTFWSWSWIILSKRYILQSTWLRLGLEILLPSGFLFTMLWLFCVFSYPTFHPTSYAESSMAKQHLYLSLL